MAHALQRKNSSKKEKGSGEVCRVLLPQEVPSIVKSLQKNIIPQGPELYLLKEPSLSPAALSAAPAWWVRPAGLSSPPPCYTSYPSSLPADSGHKIHILISGEIRLFSESGLYPGPSYTPGCLFHL